MRVVIDTNVFVSSFFGGKPRRIIDLWKEGKITLCLSGPIMDEYMAVLQRSGLDQEDLRALVDFFSRGINIVFTARTPTIRVVEDDPDDDKFIECAVALKAKVVITGDKALLAVREHRDVRITTPSRFLEELAL